MTSGPSRAGNSIDNDDLMRFADGVLDDAGRVRVLTHLASRPSALERLESYLGQNARLRALRRALPMDDSRDFARPLQAALVERLSRPPRRGRRYAYGLAAAVAAALLAGVVGIGYEPLRSDRDGGETTTAMAPTPAVFPYAAAELVAVGGNGPPAVEATDDDGAFRWLERHVGDFSLSAPALDRLGLALVGGETMRVGEMPVIRIGYEDEAGSPVVLYAAVARSEAAIAFRSVEEGQLSMQWRRGPMIFALVAPTSSPQLSNVVELVGKAVARTIVPEHEESIRAPADTRAGPVQAIAVPLARPERGARALGDSVGTVIDPAMQVEPVDANAPASL